MLLYVCLYVCLIAHFPHQIRNCEQGPVQHCICKLYIVHIMHSTAQPEN